MINRNATKEVNSSIMVFAGGNVKRSNTIRQKPKRFAEMANICCDVLFGVN